MKVNKNKTSNKQILSLFVWMSIVTVVFAGYFCLKENWLEQLRILCISSSQVSTSYFEYGIGATFLNVCLIQLLMVLLFGFSKEKLNGTSVLAFILTSGFCFWGINILNVWFCFFGMLVYKFLCRGKDKLSVNLLLFSTGAAPLYTELLTQQLPYDLSIYIRVLIVLLISLVIAYIINKQMPISNKIHKGYCIYGAGWPVGLATIAGYTLVYRLLFSTTVSAKATGIENSFVSIALGYYLILFGGIILYALLNDGYKGYLKLLRATGYNADYFLEYSFSSACLNISIQGLFYCVVYLLIGAKFNAVTIGCVLCMTAAAAKGTNLRNVIGIILGYLVMSAIVDLSQYALFKDTTLIIQSQAIVTGLCFANGLSVISGKEGLKLGVIAGMLHFCIVICIPLFHGAFCLYNGGFSGVCTAFILTESGVVKSK